MKVLPLLTSFIAGTVGWAIGRPTGVFTATILSIVGISLGFYYGRKYVKNLTS
jgi:hypothetical protein